MLAESDERRVVDDRVAESPPALRGAADIRGTAALVGELGFDDVVTAGSGS